ncbi:hypothetical protein MyNCGM683_53590 [Achromobacter xylosoxidans]
MAKDTDQHTCEVPITLMEITEKQNESKVISIDVIQRSVQMLLPDLDGSY